MQRALERHKAGTCRVVPILLRPTYWEDAPLAPYNSYLTDALSSLDGATGRRKKSVIFPLVERTMQHHHMAGQRCDSGQLIWIKGKGLRQIQPSLRICQGIRL